MRPNHFGNNRGHNTAGLLGPGPLMTGHLKVSDLDRELGDLRRKRELIQREQQLITLQCEMERQRQYEQTNRNVSNVYGNVWQPSPPKRANVPQPVHSWRGVTHNTLSLNMPKFLPSNYIPSLLDKKIDLPQQPLISNASILKPIIHPILQDRIGRRVLTQTQVRKDYHTPSKVMKKKPQNPPNKLNSYPEKERKDLVSKALDQSKPALDKSFTPPEELGSLILQEDQIPSQRITGRLELALGNIVKEIKSTYSNDDEFQKAMSKLLNQRVLKQAIRERIRTVMINKIVYSVVDIVNNYRLQFPKKTDKDLVDLVINNDRHTFVETESPEAVFKDKIDSMLEKRLQEIVLHLQKMYSSDPPNTTSSDSKPGDNAKMMSDKSPEKESELNTEQITKVLRNLTGKYVAMEEKVVLTKYYTDLIDKILKEQLPQHLLKCKEEFCKILNLDQHLNDIKAAAVRDAENYSTRATKILQEIKHKPFNTNEIIDVDALENDGDKKEIDIENDETDKINVDKNKKMAEAAAAGNNVTRANNKITQGKNVELTKNIFVKQIVSDNVKSLNKTDKTANVAAAVAGPSITSDVLSSSPIPVTPVSNKAHESTLPMQKKTLVSSKTPTTPIKPCTPAAKELPYNIKLIGKPTLPARPVICDFLNSYKPTSIKKHKTINNLLVVGFNNQDDYKRILEANETVIGEITIIIKTSEKVVSGKESEAPKTGNDGQKESGTVINSIKNETENGEKTENEMKEKKDTQKEMTPIKIAKNEEYLDKDLIGKELDDQITNLLTAIKEVDEDTEINKPEVNEDDSNKSEVSNEPEKVCLATVKEVDEGDKNKEDKKNDMVKEDSKVNIKANSTPARSSSRLANVTPCTIRTRRASRLMQESSSQ